MRATRRIQRRTNMSTILGHCLSKPRTVSELAELSEITRPATESVVTDLIELGWIEATDTPPENDTMGRPAAYYHLSKHAGSVISLDIGAHHITVLSADLAGNVLSEQTQAISEDAPLPERLNLAVKLARQTSATTSPNPPLLCAVGTPGTHYQGVVTYYGGAGLPGLEGINLRQELCTKLGIPVITAGDCALGARGESWCGAASGVSDVVFILAGKRTGAASVIDGRVREGLSGAAGLIGELTPLRWREIEEERFAPAVYPSSQPPREEIIAAARKGDKSAQRALSEYARVLALGAAAMVLAIAPECVVIGGQFGEDAEIFLPDFIEFLGQSCPFLPRVYASTLGSRAVALGGVRFALDTVFDTVNYHVTNTDYFPAPNGLFHAAEQSDL